MCKHSERTHMVAMFFLLQMRSSSPSRGWLIKPLSLSHFSRNASPASESDTRKTPTSQNVHKLQTGSSLSYDKRYPETPVSLGKLDIPRTVFGLQVYKDGFLLCVTLVYSGVAQLSRTSVPPWNTSINLSLISAATTVSSFGMCLHTFAL